MAANEGLSELTGSLGPPPATGMSQSTPPGGWREANGAAIGYESEKAARSRPRTFPYFKYLPYNVENQAEREENLNTYIKHLYIAVSASDFAPGAVHWTREIRGWLSLKFDMPKDVRVKLVRLYYELALAPGLDYLVAERFASMFMVLTKRKHYLRNGKDLTLDWRPLYKELKIFVLPTEVGAAAQQSTKRNVRTLTKLCSFAQLFFNPAEIPAMIDEILPFFSTSFIEDAYVVIGLINLLMPTHACPDDRPDLLPQTYLPSFFHLWSLVNRSRYFDVYLIDVLSRLARDSLTAQHIPFSEYGIFTEEQSSLIFTSILRLLDIPVGQATSAYSGNVDANIGLGLMLDRDQRKHPVAHHMARWIVMSLSPACLDKPNSILANLESLIQAVETFYHPSNSGSWTKVLSQLVYYLADFFVMRWNREHSGEMEVPEERRLNDAVKKRFVLCLRDVIFMGIFAKSGTAVSFSLSTLQSLAYLEPNLILPGALQRFYPALQGLVEVHRTISSIRALQNLVKVMARTKGYRCHITTLLGLALPGVDPNDLEKTLHTLAYIQAITYNVPFHDLTKEKTATLDVEHVDGATTPMEEDTDTGLAVRWITEQMDRMEQEGAGIEIDYEKELSDDDERKILKSSTTGLSEFLMSFLGRVFTLLENLPDASRVRSGSPEENVVNTLPATFTPLLAALSPELYDIALNRIADFISNHVIHQARDAMAFICNALVKVNPRKALQRLLPDLIASIRTEIDDNGAGSTRTTGSEVLPRDRALVWNISLLSMCVVHVGDAVLVWRKELFTIANYMQEKTRGIPTVHVSNFVHHLLLNLTVVYTLDYSIFEPDELARGLTTGNWGKSADPKNVSITWHKPSQDELDFAVELFQSQAQHAIFQLNALTGDNSPIKRDGTGKDWSDEISRNLVLLRLIISGLSVMFDPRYQSEIPESELALNGSIDKPRSNLSKDIKMEDNADEDEDEDESGEDANLGEAEDEEVKPTFQYETGYPLEHGSEQYQLVHNLRQLAGETLHKVHVFLTQQQEDDVTCFNSLYNAYRSWFVDVGIERSAHVLDRVTRLLAADIHPFKFSGLRKQYPRSLLVRRANVYHLQRLRHNANPRPKTELDKMLLLDLAQSSVSLYTEIRRTAQSANESAVKCIIGSRAIVIPPLLDTFVEAVKENDYPRIKGALFSLLFGSLAKTIGRDWRFTPTLIKAFIETTSADKPSVQRTAANATFQIMDMGKALERMVILDKTIVEAIAVEVDETEADRIERKIDKKRNTIKRKRANIEVKKAKLSEELITIAKDSHWRKASRASAIVVGLGMRYDTIASDSMIDLIVKGSIDPHPSLRSLYTSALVGVFSLIQARSLTKHDYEKFLLASEEYPDKIQVATKADDPKWTEEFLSRFSQPEADYYIDYDYPGWLVWNKTMPGYMTDPPCMEYDEVETEVRRKIGRHLDRHWFSTFFAFMKQEPRDQNADRFRMSSALMLTHALELVFAGGTVATFEDIKDLIQAVFGDGSDKHQHRATAEIMGGLLSCAQDFQTEQRIEVWEYVFPLLRGIFRDGLTPENSHYWNAFVNLILQNKDPRRAWPLVEWLASFRLDMSSSAAFKESAKIQLLQQSITDAGWHFQLDKPIMENFLAHLDHPYKAVREQIGGTIFNINRMRLHESYPNIKAFMDAQRSASSIGVRPYQPTEEFTQMMKEVFKKLETWRKERPAGQQTPSSYTQGSKTVLLWLEASLASYECIQLVPFFPDLFTEEFLHMMDIKEDPELQALAYHVFRHMPNVPQRRGEDEAFINALIRIGRESSSWHQRLRVLINIQVIYFRRLFLMTLSQQQALFDCVSAMLSDSQLEVRSGAQTTLSGMIRCSSVDLRDRMVIELKDRFTTILRKSPLPKQRTPGTPTPDHNNLIIRRHSAVLGLGALVQAFPYTSPPPNWLPDVLATLALKAAGDPGSVGKSVKSILADFKKTRQDTWHVDVKAFEPEQLEDLEGVLWKSYFA